MTAYNALSRRTDDLRPPGPFIFDGEEMNDLRGRTRRLAAPFVLLGGLLLFGCSKPEEPPIPTPPPGAKADTEALQRKMAELKAKNPNLPPMAIGTMAAKMVQEEKARGGAPR